MFSCRCNLANCHLHFLSFGRMTGIIYSQTQWVQQWLHFAIIEKVDQYCCCVHAGNCHNEENGLAVLSLGGAGNQTLGYSDAHTTTSLLWLSICHQEKWSGFAFLVFTRISIYWKQSAYWSDILVVIFFHWCWRKRFFFFFKCSTMRQCMVCVCAHSSWVY